MLTKIIRQSVVGITLLELGKLPLDFGGLSLGLELANVLEPFFRRAFLGFGTSDSAPGGAEGARALERQCRFAKSVSVPSQTSSGRRPRGLPRNLRCALSLRRGRRLVRACALARVQTSRRSRSCGSRLCLLALAQSFGRTRDIRCEPPLPRTEALVRALLLSIAPRCGLRNRRCRRPGNWLLLDSRRLGRLIGTRHRRRHRVQTGLPLEHHERQRSCHDHGRGERYRRAPATRREAARMLSSTRCGGTGASASR